MRVVFNGNGYDEANQKMLVKERGLLQLNSGVDSIEMMTNEKNMKLFESQSVLTREELTARQTVMLNHYVETVKMEAECLLQMATTYYASIEGENKEMENAIEQLRSDIHETFHSSKDLLGKAKDARVMRLEKMIKFRQTWEEDDEQNSNAMSYTELLFNDDYLPHTHTDITHHPAHHRNVQSSNVLVGHH